SEFLEFVRRLVSIRRSHSVLRAGRFKHGQSTPGGDPDVQWLRPDGEVMSEENWHNSDSRFVALLLSDGSERLLMVFNAHPEPVEFLLPDGQSWQLLLATSDDRHGSDALY